MNKVIEEALTNMVRRIEELEEKIRKLINKPHENKNVLATPGQIKYLKILGFKPFEGMTKQHAGKEIDKLVKQRENKISEPPEVDNDDIGLDEDGLL